MYIENLFYAFIEKSLFAENVFCDGLGAEGRSLKWPKPLGRTFKKKKQNLNKTQKAKWFERPIFFSAFQK